jgi:ketosteroid isomerase-like protein
MPSEQIVRKPLRVRESSRRTPEQRALLRFPSIAAAAFRRVGKLPPGSRLRQAALWRGVRIGLEAYNRRDLAVAAAGFHPELEYYPYREFVEAGLAEPCYHGRSGYIDYIESTYDVWGAGVQLHPRELIDLGERLVVLADMPMRAQGSGVALDEAYGSVWDLKDGMIVRAHDFLRHDEALRFAGLEV